MSNHLTSRRSFFQAAAAGSTFLILGTKASGQIRGANDRVRIATAGLNGRGKSHIAGWLDQSNVELAYVADVDENVLSQALKDIERRTGNSRCTGVIDIRRALDDKNVDAISVAAPNHWHSLMTIWGAQAGKNVYVEKPMSHDVQEGRVAVEAAKKYGVVIQHGTQRRSDAQMAGLIEQIKAGKFGKLKISYGYACKPRNGIGFRLPSPPPRNVNWYMWKGPAAIHQFHRNFVHYNWHWFWASGNGELNNQGTHQLDVARWAIDDDQTHPIRATAIGGRFQWEDQGETPNTMFGVAEYPNGQFVFFNVRNVNYPEYEHQVLNEFYFEDGGSIRGRDGQPMYFAKGSKEGQKLDIPPGKVTPGGNWGAFVAAVRAGDPMMANGNVYDAHYGCVLGHLMNNSYRLGQQVPFDVRSGSFGDIPDAAEHFAKLHAIMRDGVGVNKTPNNDAQTPEAQYVAGPWLTFDPRTERHTGDFATEANALLKDPNNAAFRVPTVDEV